MDQEKHSVKYVREIVDYWDEYIKALIDEIYVGAGIALGLSEKEARKLSENNPKKLEKAFFKGILNRLKNIFKKKAPKPFIAKKGELVGAPTEEQWEKFNKSIDAYWKRYANSITEDVTIKTFMLGRDTTDFRIKKKPYVNKSLVQVNFEQYKGNMPSTIKEAYDKYDFNNAEKNALNKVFSRSAMYITEQNNEIKEAIRKQVQNGIEENKTPTQIASDLYWEVEKGELNNKYTSERIKRNWNRIATTESTTIYESGVLAPYEAEAMESLKDPTKAKYFVFTGGTCPWCRAHQGVLTRLVPSEIVKDPANDSLKSMGIYDPNTDIAIWIGKNNVGFKENKNVHEWRVTTPAHPHNVATMQPINIETEFFNKKTGKVEKRQREKEFIPQKIDYSYQTEEQKDARKPVFIGENLVRRGHNIYEAVPHDEYDKKLREHEKNPTLPIPVDMDSTGYRYIFKEAEKNK